MLACGPLPNICRTPQHTKSPLYKTPWPRRHRPHQRQRMLSEGGLPWQQPELIQSARAGPPMGTLWCLPRRRVLIQPAIEPVFRGPKLSLKKLPDLPSLLAHIALFSS